MTPDGADQWHGTGTNVGKIVTVGQEAMRVVPDDSSLELKVYVLNTDIGVQGR